VINLLESSVKDWKDYLAPADYRARTYQLPGNIRFIPRKQPCRERGERRKILEMDYLSAIINNYAWL